MEWGLLDYSWYYGLCWPNDGEFLGASLEFIIFYVFSLEFLVLSPGERSFGCSFLKGISSSGLM